MEQLTTSPAVSNSPETSAFELVETIEKGVQRALELCDERPPKVAERRKHPRRPYPYPFFITPLGSAGEPLADQSYSVIGNRISLGGIDFYHRQAIPQRHVIASFPLPMDNEWVAFVLELKWCRFNRFGWYDNGGRFLRMVPSPVQDDPSFVRPAASNDQQHPGVLPQQPTDRES